MLKWDKDNEQKVKHTKFQPLWLGPHQIVENLGSGTYRLQNLGGNLDPLPINGEILKKCFSRLLERSRLSHFYNSFLYSSFKILSFLLSFQA